MTKKFDDRAREELLFVYKKPDLSNIKPRQLEVKRIPCNLARGYIAAFHYSKTMPDSSRFIYGLYYKTKLCGVCVFGMGCGKNQFTSIYPDVKKGHYIELTRLWVEDSLGKNTESYFISKCLRLLPPEIQFVVSFSDEKHGHYGYIYQATNFLYLGQNNGGKMLLTKDGIEKHPRLLGIYRSRHTEYRDCTNQQLMDILGYKYTESGRKFRYVYFRDKRLKKKLNIKSLEYPKEKNGGANDK